MLVLNEDQVREGLTYNELIPALRRAFMAYSAGCVQQPLRSVMRVNDGLGWFALMPAVCDDVMGAKLVTFFPGNAAQAKHTHHAMIQLFGAATGEPLAVMDGRLITEMRTAAVSAIAVDLLAPAQASKLAILGSGVQARSHLRALTGIRAFNEVSVWSRTHENAQRFANATGAITASTVEEAVAEADVVLTLTSSVEPILFGKWLKSDALVCAVGAVTPDRRELDDEAMRGSVVVESREAAEKEPGDILHSGAKITAEIGELLNGAAFDRGDRPVIFKSVGIAIEDIAAAKLVYERTTSRAAIAQRQSRETPVVL
jgi:ornithine cyclodeaminase/alanine dehydrogenase-like protein (mu-crystallin family)